MIARKIICLFLLWTAFSGITYSQNNQVQNDRIAQIEQQIQMLQQQTDQITQQHNEQIGNLRNQIESIEQSASAEEPETAEDELARLRQLAEGIAGEQEEEKSPEETVFKFSGLSLQQLNPEISASGDFVAHVRRQEQTRERADAEIRGLELNFQSYLDPFSRFKATTHIHGDGEVEVEELYFTHFSMIENANLDIGRFRQQFGVINRWHGDALDQVEYPLVLQRIFGEDGLNQTGASIDWTLPGWDDAFQELTVQITNTENERLFGGDAIGNPSMLFHYKNYRDLSRDTYLEIGLSGLFGWNDRWDVDKGSGIEDEYDALGTQVFGADLAMLWEPADKALYKNLEWRSEAYLLNRDLLAPDNSGRDNLNAWGAYSYINSKISRNMEVGIRADYFKPDSKNYANTANASIVPLAYTSNNPHRWQVCPYITVWQSEWVKFRFEYDYAFGRGMEETDHLFMLQAVFGVGPHKHERY